MIIMQKSALFIYLVYFQNFDYYPNIYFSQCVSFIEEYGVYLTLLLRLLITSERAFHLVLTLQTTDTDGACRHKLSKDRFKTTRDTIAYLK